LSTTPSAPSRCPLAPGDLLAGRYRIERVIAVGGMGTILAARHQDLDQEVAVKVLKPEVLGHDDAVPRFVREARTAARLQNEHVARVFDAGVLDGGIPYMVMEYLRGLDLQQVMNTRGPLPLVDVVDYVLQTLEAVAEAYALGVVHRDLKPSNLFLASRPDGKTHVKVLDFGISKPRGGAETLAHRGLTSDRVMVGSPAYMSPEQIRSPKSVDGRTDLWALGVILHELCTGETLFSGDTLGEILASILQKPIPPLSQQRADVPEAFERIVLRCLARDEAARYADAAELARDLEPFGSRWSKLSVERITGMLGMRDADARPVLVRHPSLPSGASEAVTRRVTSSRWGLSSARTLGARGVAIAAVTLGAALLLFGGWWRVRGPARAAGEASAAPLDPSSETRITPLEAGAITAAPADPLVLPVASVAPAESAKPERARARPPSDPRPSTKRGKKAVDVLDDRQ